MNVKLHCILVDRVTNDKGKSKIVLTDLKGGGRFVISEGKVDTSDIPVAVPIHLEAEVKIFEYNGKTYFSAETIAVKPA